ncbi:hypothetical protein PF005_g15174 [Phytophthora fragariae]|uniref:Uncharacterized protein n=2 Tax=Phytophthora TaxID=4783 RepID=A0A6A3K4E2_9STRA|nr:hypothetical protein PF003_g8849 [Phytophthora fragariae]KAE9023784.1 hypothetical protein PR001_g12828 [Phytophthora rubi]KAE8933483.1 hypothetical protein PF009_g16508 [Phytophthora fragariae]KAE9000418.1 hypothetical protein PF011_g14185 [Phytophthora fragariae]KAE9100335.1 hypothetical protein PF010_g14847 [Phytophthora fragariae]
MRTQSRGEVCVPRFRVCVNLGIEYVDGMKSGNDVVCFIKRFRAPLAHVQPQAAGHRASVAP